MKKYVCDRCGEDIEPGNVFRVVSGILNGEDAEGIDLCGRCYAAHRRFLTKQDEKGPVRPNESW